jgi:hypothetical protein
MIRRRLGTTWLDDDWLREEACGGIWRSRGRRAMDGSPVTREGGVARRRSIVKECIASCWGRGATARPGKETVASRLRKGTTAVHDLDLGAAEEGEDVGDQNRVRQRACIVPRRKRREKGGT